MPNFMTNGQAANLTAEAVTAAIRLTGAYVFGNASEISEEDVKNRFVENINATMLLVGGSIRTTAPF